MARAKSRASSTPDAPAQAGASGSADGASNATAADTAAPADAEQQTPPAEAPAPTGEGSTAAADTGTPPEAAEQSTEAAPADGGDPGDAAPEAKPYRLRLRVTNNTVMALDIPSHRLSVPPCGGVAEVTLESEAATDSFRKTLEQMAGIYKWTERAVSIVRVPEQE